ncbi:MAG: bis(5'-nucleosyl)-tetraphosphatase (symmetrical) YqeK [Peptostreptococcaceae bacterium]
MNKEEIYNRVSEMLPQKRFIHSLNVAKCAVELSKVYGLNEESAYIAGITHDCAKYLTEEKVNYYVNKYKIKLDEFEINNIALSHSLIGSYIALNELEIKDEDIISSIKYHTTGKENMTMLEKVIYMSDLIEENRSFPGVDLLRKKTFEGELDEALLISFNNTIKFVIDNNQLIHPRTINARNYLMKQKIDRT